MIEFECLYVVSVTTLTLFSLFRCLINEKSLKFIISCLTSALFDKLRE